MVEPASKGEWMRTEHHKKTDVGIDVPPAAAANGATQTVNGQARRKSKKPKSKFEDSAEDGLSFWDFAAGLGDRWSTGDLKTVVYRTWPRIDKKEEAVYLTITQEPPTEQSLLESFGSGRYLVFIKDRGKMLRKKTASVSHPDCPPKVNESEVLTDDPANASYFAGWGRKRRSLTEATLRKKTALTLEI
jgi:hypothetical protein